MSSIVVSAVRDDALARSVCTRNAQCEPPRRCQKRKRGGVHESDQRSPASEGRGRGGRVGGTFSAPRGSHPSSVKHAVNIRYRKVLNTRCEDFQHPVGWQKGLQVQTKTSTTTRVQALFAIAVSAGTGTDQEYLQTFMPVVCSTTL